MPMISRTRFAGALLSCALALIFVVPTFAAEAFKVETVKDEDGWRLVVDGKDFQVKGVVWAYTPIGENYSYDLWSKDEDFIRRMVDTDMALLKKMGTTTIRCFSTIPPEWIEYIYTRYGITTIVNDLFGRYGVTVDGRWNAYTDYSDPATRKLLLEQARKTYETYKDTKGVLFYMLGNESNYGLEWKSNAIENLPGGERMDAKARYLYSLFAEAIAVGKEIDPNHPIGIVNGDLGYLELIAELCPDLDILGVNTYRGRKAYAAFYASVDEILDRPLVFTEFGADAYNVATEQEDQYHQADYLKDQWEELYGQAYGKGKIQNVLGGFVFEWIDEWWKHGMETGLSEHDTTGTWNNGAYDFDAVPGKKNMNEEWFGIVGQSKLTENGINRRLPRASYYLLQKIWTLNLYKSTPKQVKDAFAALSLAEFAAMAEPQTIRNELAEREPLSVKGSLDFRTLFTGTDQDLDAGDIDGIKEKLSFRHMESASLDVAFRPQEYLTGGLTTKFATPNRFYDSTDGLTFTPLSWFAAPAAFTWEKGDEQAVSLYSAWATWDGPQLRADFLYRTGHADWQLEGDFFGLLPESFDRYGMDLNRQSAPFGVELAFKETLEGLKLYGGPEIYAGARPTLMVKYWKSFGELAFGAIHQEEVAYPDASLATSTQIAEQAKTPLTRRSSLYFQGDFLPVIKAQAGLLMGSPEKIGETFTNAMEVAQGTGSGGSDWKIYQNQAATALDALGTKLRFTTGSIPYVPQASIQGLYLGPLAGGEPFIARGGSQIADPGTGNRIELEADIVFIYGNLAFAPKFLWRQPVYGPLPSIPALSVAPRTYEDLFYVWNNRETVQGEAVLTWDPTGATWFHEWNNDDREEAPLAASLSFLYDFYRGPTDRSHFLAGSPAAVGTVYSWDEGLPEISGTWSLTGRLVARPLPSLRLIATANAGKGQSGGDPAKDPVSYAGATLRAALDRLVFSGELHADSWGPETWYREFQATFPLQAKLGLAWAFSPPSLMNQTNRVGVDVLYRSFGSDSPADQSVSGTLDSRFEVQAYLNVSL